MNGEELLQKLRNAVKPKPKPAILLSGGLDSTILLHHLTEKSKEPIHTTPSALRKTILNMAP